MLGRVSCFTGTTLRSSRRLGCLEGCPKRLICLPLALRQELVACFFNFMGEQASTCRPELCNGRPGKGLCPVAVRRTDYRTEGAIGENIIQREHSVLIGQKDFSGAGMPTDILAYTGQLQDSMLL